MIIKMVLSKQRIKGIIEAKKKRYIHTPKKLKNVDVILNPNGDHIEGIVETNVPNVLWNKKMYGISKVKGYNGWKDKDGQKRDYSSSTRENYEIQTKKSLKAK